MTISCQITRRDYVQACVAMSGKARWGLFSLWLALVAFSLALSHDEWLHGTGSQRIALSTPLVLCGLFFMLVLWISPRYRARRMILRACTWTLSESGVHLESNVSSGDLKWEAFIKFAETSELFLLFVQKSAAQLIPKRVLTPEQIEELRSLLAAHIKAA